MLLGVLNASLLGNLLTGKDKMGADEGAIAESRGRDTIRAGKNFWCHPISSLILNIMKMNPHLMAFIQKIIYLQ